MDFIHNKNLGFNKDALIVIPITDKNLVQNIDPLKQNVLKSSNIISATCVSDIPGSLVYVTNAYYEGLSSNDVGPTIPFLKVDRDFIKTFKLRLIEGKDFSTKESGEWEYIINESAQKYFNWQLLHFD